MSRIAEQYYHLESQDYEQMVRDKEIIEQWQTEVFNNSKINYGYEFSTSQSNQGESQNKTRA